MNGSIGFSFDPFSDFHLFLSFHLTRRYRRPLIYFVMHSEFTPTQEQIEFFHNSKKWKEFKKLFPSTSDALKAHALLCQKEFDCDNPTHVLTWRFIYDSKESMSKTLLCTLLIPFGIGVIHYTTFAFQTNHKFSNAELRKFRINELAKSFALNACFALLFLSLITIPIPILMIGEYGITFLSLLSIPLPPALIISILIFHQKIKRWATPSIVKKIAKDNFDLLQIDATNA